MFGMFEWQNAYLTGIGSIDAQHQSLFQIGRKLYDAMSTGKGKAVLGSTLERLVTYTEGHFAHEERLMRLGGFPDFAAHKAQHDALTRQVRKFQKDFEAGHSAITVQVLQFLSNWLVEHVKGNDLKYVPYLVSRSVA